MVYCLSAPGFGGTQVSAPKSNLSAPRGTQILMGALRFFKEIYCIKTLITFSEALLMNEKWFTVHDTIKHTSWS